LKAYNLLTKVAAAIGWDQLLKVRSEVFVMEEEYRVERQHVPKPAQSLDAEMNGNSAEQEDDTGSVNGPAAVESTEEIPNGDGDENHGQSPLERPEQTVASEVVKSGNEDVSAHNTNEYD
jgi:hypothetical protein